MSQSERFPMTAGMVSDDLFSPQLLDIIADAVTGAMLVYDRTDTIVFASPQLKSFLPAFAVAPVPGTRLRDIFGTLYDHGGYWPNQPEPERRSRVGRADWIAGEIAALWKERAETAVQRGNDRWMSLTTRRMPSGFGICIFRDISEHRKREDQWRSDLERVQVTEEILDSLPFPVTVQDRNFAYVAVNRAACALYDLPSEQVLGRRTTDLHSQTLSARVDRVNQQIIDTGAAYQIAEKLVRPDGGETAAITRKFRVGKPGRYLVVTAMEDLSEVAEAGLQAGRRLTGLEGVDFVQSDLRRPCDRAAPVRPAADEIAERRILLVTSDISIERDGLPLLLELGLDATAARNPQELRAILAVARDTGVTIDLVVIDGAMDVACLELAQTCGVDVLVFDAFQLHNDLVKNITRHLRRPSAVSEPLDDGDDWQISTDSSIDILVAEDNAVNQIVFTQILEGFGYRYAIASDGEEAVRLWRELSPKLVLMDITLPVLNGFEAASKIRESEEIPGTTPIIGVLSPAVEGDRDACWAAGIDDVVMKPLSPDILEEKFRQYLGQTFRTWRQDTG
jgi:PAS domain S-box-containing protein